MRELIDVNFIDKTNYADQASGDVGGILLYHHWGPVGKLNSLTLPEFTRLYPTSTKRLHPSWINAFRAFQSGLGSIEVFRVQGDNKYKYFLTPTTAAVPTVSDAASLSVLTDPAFSLRYAGVPAEMINGKSLVFESKDISAEEGYNDAGFPPAMRINIFLVDKASAATADLSLLTPIETHEGFTEVGFQLEGQNAFIGSRVQSNSQLLQFVNNSSKSFLAFDFKVIFEFDAASAPADVSADSLAGAYADVFSDIEASRATILIDPGTKTNTAANSVLAAASVQARADLVAVVGYPVQSEFDEASILAYKQSLSPAQFGGFYATRELITVNGVNYTSNGLGTIAGRIAAVAASANVNQLPSAKTWGQFGGVITQSLTFKEVLALHLKGVNSVYASVDGARIFGLRSLHARSTCYYAKFNVSRVSARILRYGFSVALNALHTGNTGALKASVQNLLDADLTRLKASGDIKSQSSVLCADKNNHDIDTNGGEILIIDYEIWFVKLVERVKFTITATDNSVSVTQS